MFYYVSDMKVYILTEVYDPESDEIIKVFDSEKKARDYVHRNYKITKYDDSSDKRHIRNFVVYYWTETNEVLIQAFEIE